MSIHIDEDQYQPMSGWQFCHLPEFKALADRLNLNLEKKYTRVIIDSGGPDDCVKVTFEHYAIDAHSIDTTSHPNEVWNTSRPSDEQTNLSVS